tara:strand:- start:2734 stop:3345 length:612 start_codon:yes stop_codon:yes gene_type:complete
MNNFNTFTATPKCTGSMLNAWVGKDNSTGILNSVVLVLTQQASWDDKKKQGYFKENLKNPSKENVISLNRGEVGRLIRYLGTVGGFPFVQEGDKKRVSSIYHNYNDKVTTLELGEEQYSPKTGVPYQAIKVSQKDGGTWVNINHTMQDGELEAFRIWLQEAIIQMYHSQLSERPAPASNTTTAPTATAPEPEKQEEDDGDVPF